MKLLPFLTACMLLSLLGPSPASATQYLGAEVYQLVQPFGPVYGLTVGHTLYGRPVSGTQAVGSSLSQAFMWNGPAGAATSLHSLNFWESFVCETDGLSQVGYSNGNETHALLWHGTAESMVDLHPTLLPFSYSIAYGVHGNQQVGHGGSNTGDLRIHALLWRGTPQSAIDLHPTNLGTVYESTALATDGVRQVGYILAGQGAQAVMWSGSAGSAIDLHGAALSNFVDSIAYGVGGGQQVGYGTAGNQRALLWSGSAASAVDLHPTTPGQYLNSYAYATNGSVQIGEGFTVGHNRHALLWKGTAASLIDLHNLLPSGYTDSFAASIDAQGIIYGIAKDESFRLHLVKWTPAHAGDFDSDGDVDGADFVAWQTNFPKASGATLTQGDADEDGDVDAADFVVWQTHFPYTPGPGASPVPEPATFILAIAAVATLGFWRRRAS